MYREFAKLHAAVGRPAPTISAFFPNVAYDFEYVLCAKNRAWVVSKADSPIGLFRKEERDD